MKSTYPLNSIYIYFTKYCNLNCIHCWNEPVFVNKNIQKNDDLCVDDYICFLEQAKRLGLKTVKITGGEAFLRKDIKELMMWLKKNNIKISIETNGTLITEEVANLIIESGVYFLSVSLNGSNSKIHNKMVRVKGSFENTINGIKLIKKCISKLPVQIIFSLWRENEDDILNMLEFIKIYRLNSLKINIITKIGRGKKLCDDYLRVEEILKIYKETLNINKKFNVKVFFDIPMVFKPLDEIFNCSFGTSICNIKNMLGVLSDGTISICGIGRAIKELSFGNIKKDKLINIWNNNEILRQIREYIPQKLEGVCSRCMMKKICLGKCRAEAYSINSSIYSAHDFCQKAYEQGLFPKTRLVS